MKQTVTIKSVIFLMTSDTALADDLYGWCRSDGWQCAQGDTADAAVAAARDGAALLLLDGRTDAEAAGEVVTAVRALPGFAAGTPILECAGDSVPALPGTRARIAMPWSAITVRAAIEQWAGPMQAHAMRHTEDPRYRLIRLLGRDAADPMLDRFATVLEEVLTQPATSREEAHRLTGLAGMLGFSHLSGLWSAFERADPTALPDALKTARTSTQNCLDALRAKK